MQVDISSNDIKYFLEQGGMSPSLSNQYSITAVQEGGLAITFKIVLGENGVYYIKFHDAEGARGGVFLKHLLPLGDPVLRAHAEKRRHHIRKMLDSVVKQRDTMVPKPCYFDLRSCSMAQQKLRKHTEHVVAELRVEGRKYPPRLQGMVGSLWQGLDIQHIPTLSSDKKDVWNPLDYSLDNVFQCTATLGEIQKATDLFLQHTVQRKVLAGKGSEEQVRNKLYGKLQHEQRGLLGYSKLSSELFAAFGFDKVGLVGEKSEESLRALGRKIHGTVQDNLRQKQASSIKELQNRFLQSVQMPANSEKLSFK